MTNWERIIIANIAVMISNLVLVTLNLMTLFTRNYKLFDVYAHLLFDNFGLGFIILSLVIWVIAYVSSKPKEYGLVRN